MRLIVHKCKEGTEQARPIAMVCNIHFTIVLQSELMSDSDLSSEKQQPLKREKSRASIPREKSIPRERSIVPSQSPRAEPPKQITEDPTGLQEENKRLRRKLKELSIRLDEELEKAASNKLKHKNQKNGHPVSLQSQNLQLQNAYKMIERLQKAVKDYESKESYQVTLKRVMDLEGIIKKKEAEIEDLKTEVKTLKKMGKDKDKHVEELIENTKKMGNPTEDLEMINKLKTKMKKVLEENEHLRRKELEKHEKLVKAERRLVEMEQNDREVPIANDENLMKELQQQKRKYKESLQRIERQNIYISKLNEKLNRAPVERERKSERQSERNSERRNKSLSMEELPELKKKINPVDLLGHLPSPPGGNKLRRY